MLKFRLTGTIRKISKYYFCKCDLDLSFVFKIYDLSLTLFVDVNAIHKIFTLLEYLIFSTQIYRSRRKEIFKAKVKCIVF